MHIRFDATVKMMVKIPVYDTESNLKNSNDNFKRDKSRVV